MTINRQFRLAARPVGMPRATDWQLTEEPLAPLRDGEVRVRVLYLSLDPAMRGWMNEGKSYIRPVAIGEVVRAGGVGVEGGVRRRLSHSAGTPARGRPRDGWPGRSSGWSRPCRG